MKALLTQSAKGKLLEQLEQLEQFEQSGKTYAQFAEWRHQKKTTSGVKLVEIKITDISTAKEIKIRKSGMEILIPENLDRL